ncbi:MAG: Arginine--tRNA ligase [Candidatus Thorarchaeota archaeon]|nr:MAG: Arginine--tRNA ligase [Candidatus Thorarchaeota archaeon]
MRGTSSNPWKSVIDFIVEIIAEKTELDRMQIIESLEVPPDPNLGDLATTVSFQLAKIEKKNPALIANKIVEYLEQAAEKEGFIERIESKGPYINIFLNRGALAKFVISCVSELDTDYGKSDSYKGLRALLEYPAVNPSKPWHIGHTRNAVIGDTLGNILEHVGYDVIRLDYINDLGLQIAQITWKLMMDGEPENIEEKYDHFLGKIYVEVQEAFEKFESIEKEIREVSRKLEDLSSSESKHSLKMVTKCVKAQYQTAYRLGIYHDYQVWESAIAHSGLLEIAREKMMECENVVKLEEGEKAGCIVAKLDSIDDFKDMKDPNKVLFRSDGTRTYTGADIALQMWKFGIYPDPFFYQIFEKQPNGEEILRTALEGKKNGIGKVDLVFNVIGTAQAHPQKLVYSILDLLGYEEESQNSHHIAYEFVGLEETDFSGRKGTWIGYTCDEVLDKAKELAYEEVAKRNPDWGEEQNDQVAEQVAVGALRYFMLNASPDRKITFRWEDALDFNGDAAPYLQYSYARATRILEKIDAQENQEGNLSLLSAPQEFELVKAIAKLPEEILEVARGMRKNVWGTGFSSNRITSYSYNLATLFSRFYDSCPVLKAEPGLMAARLELVKSFRTTISNCLSLLGIPVIERM